MNDAGRGLATCLVFSFVTKGSYGSNLVRMDVGSADRLAQHDLHITEQVSDRVMPPYLFHPSLPDQAKRISSRPDAVCQTCTKAPCPFCATCA
eukprot:1139988-Pelagomonas_calceolata.AAC.2